MKKQKTIPTRNPMREKKTSINILHDSSIIHAALTTSISPIVFVDDMYTVIYANRAFFSIWGYASNDDVIGKNASLFWELESLKGKINRKLRDKGGWIGELNAYRKDGTAFPAQVSTSVLAGPEHESAYQMFTFIDISERVSAQNEQQRLLADLQERIKELKCLYTVLSVPHSAASSLESILRYIAASIPDSLRWSECAFARIVIDDIDICTSNYVPLYGLFKIPLSVAKGKGFLEVGYTPTSLDTKKLTLLDEEKDLLIAASKEIERLIDYKRNEAELNSNHERLLHADKLASIGVLSAEIMHEISNPNNYIALNVRMLTLAWTNILPILDSYFQTNGDFSVAGLPFKEARQGIFRLLDGIREGSERIQRISSRLRLFIGRKPMVTDSTFYINDAVRKAIEFSKNQIDSSTDRFETILTPLNPVIKGDADQVQQVIINFIANACQALRTRNESIRISTVMDKNSRSIQVLVDDEGIGIDPRDLPRVTDPFYSTKRDRGCCGLGLSISNDIAISHGGKILLDSTVDLGTTAILVLPAFKTGEEHND